MKCINLIPLLAASFILTACADSTPDTSDFNQDSSSNQPLGYIPPPTPPSVQNYSLTPSAFMAGISGTWNRGCSYHAAGNSYYTISIIVSGMSAVYTSTTWYSDAACSNAIINEYDSRSIVSVLASGSSWSVSSNRAAYSIRPASQGVADYYNSTGACGVTNWQAGVDNQVLNTSCGGGASVNSIVVSANTNYTVLYGVDLVSGAAANYTH